MARLGLVFGTMLVLAGCTQVVKQGELDRSLTAWNALKAENGDSYRYVVNAASVFGPLYTTTLTLQEGRVVRRDLEVLDANAEGGATVTESWSEEGTAIGSHDAGAEPVTLDERYRRCRDDVLSRSSTNDVTLEFLENGLLSSCYSVPRGAVYDGGAEAVRGLEFLPATGPADLPNPFVRALDIAEGGWNGLKTTHGDSYRYVVDAAAVFGPNFNTVLTVRSGRVVQRDFTLTELNDAGDATVLRRWRETGNALGTHDEGAALLTVDERFAACRADLEAADLAGSDIGLDYIAPTNAEPTEAFVLSYCHILPESVVDDGGGEIVRELEFLAD